MFVFNVKVNGNKLGKALLAILIIIILFYWCYYIAYCDFRNCNG